MEKWVLLSLFVLLFLAFQDIVHRYLMKEGFHAIEIVMYGLLPTVVVGGVYMLLQKLPLRTPSLAQGGLFLLSGILGFVGFLFLRQAQIQSPNIGYVNAIVYSSVIVTVLLTPLLFQDKIHWQGLVGALFVVLGISLITSGTTKK